MPINSHSAKPSPLAVLVTRPEKQAESLAALLREQQCDPLVFPVLAISPKLLTIAEKQSVEALDRYSHVICVSANAARIGLSLLSDYWPQWPVEQQWIAVGPATREAMSGWGLGDIHCPDGSSHSEGVLALGGLQKLVEQRVLILRGVSGRELLAETLRQRGAVVDYLELYDRTKPVVAPEILARWLCSERKKAIVVTSGDGLKNLVALTEESAADGSFSLRELYGIPLVVVSQRLANFAQEQGFQRVFVSEGAADSAIAYCITHQLQ